jgi:hypothetical protein
MIVKKKKKVSLTSAKKKAWAAMSRWIRLKDSKAGFCSCVTCGWTGEIASMQCGHFVPKAKGNSVYFEENNLAPQCYRCNINLGGNIVEYYSYIVHKFGQEEVERLRLLARETVKFTVQDYQAIEMACIEKIKKWEESR